MKRYCLTLDLVNDEKKIAAYEEHHKAVWPGIIQSIRRAGIIQMEIYRFGNRLFMIIDSTDEFTFEKKARADEANAEVQQWESLMWQYQQSVPGARPGEKWALMKEVFRLDEAPE